MTELSLLDQCRRYAQATSLPEQDEALRTLRYAQEGVNAHPSISAADLQAAWEQLRADGALSDDRTRALVNLYAGYERLAVRRWSAAQTKFDDVLAGEMPDGDEALGLLRSRATLGRLMTLCEDRRYDEARQVAESLPGAWDDAGASGAELALAAERDHVWGLVLRRQGQGDAAEQKIIAARNGYDRIDDPVGKARALDTLGMICRDSGRFADAMYWFQTSAQLKTTGGDRRGLAITAGNMGRMYLDWEEFDRAVEFLEQDLAICREQNDAIGMIVALHEIAEACLGQGDIPKARRQLAETETLLSRMLARERPAFTVANVAYTKAQVELASGNYAGAQTCHDDAVAAFGPTAAPTITAHLDLQQGRIEAGNYNFGTARILIDRAAATFKTMHQDAHRAHALFHGALVLIRQDALDQAVSYLADALKLARGLAATNMIARFRKECRQIDTEALMRALLTVKALNEQLRENQQWQQSLAGTVMHDLRSPLTTISGNLDLVLEQVFGEIPQEAQEALQAARLKCDWLVDLIGSILDTGKMESGALQVNPQSVALLPMIREIIPDFRSDVTHEPMQVSVDASSVNQTVWADRTLTRRVLLNLIGNAVKYGRSGSAPASGTRSDVTVRAERAGSHARVSVTDTGRGISEDDQKKLFTKYGQIGEAAKNSTGLGLYFCKLAVEAMAGEIGVRSTLGKGTTFWFTLPLEQTTRLG